MGLKPRKSPSEVEMVNKFIERMRKASEEAKLAIREAQEGMAQYYDR